MTESPGSTSASTWEGWEVVAVRCYQLLLKYALRLTKGNRESAEDIVQEAVFRVIKTNPPPRNRKAAPAYLRKAVKNVFLDAQTNEQRLRFVSYDDDENVALQPYLVDKRSAKDIHDRLENPQRGERVLKLIGPLTERQRKLLSMFLDDLSADEMAAVLGEKVSVIRHELNAMWALIDSHLKLKNFDPADY
jgi:RNA polymerase sigma factor (sigma-70 family)